MPRLLDNVRVIHHAGRTTLLHIQQGKMFRLNPVGSRIVELLRSGFSKEEIAEIIAAEFHIAPAAAADDLDEFSSALKKHGFFGE